MAQKRIRRSWQEAVDNYLIPYIEENGDALVPQPYVTPDGFRLGAWVNEQRSLCNEGQIKALRAHRLDELGFVWKVRDPSRWLKTAREYYAKHGNLNAPMDYVTPNGVPLGQHLNNARRGWRAGDLGRAIHEALDAIDPTWPTSAQRWTSRSEACNVQGCVNQRHARGWCRKHYNSWHKNGDPEASASEQESS